MAAVEAVEGKHALDRESPVARKKFKTSDLPLTQLQRSSIDGLLHTFKKKGEFDFLRKRVYAQFDEGDAKLSLTKALTDLAEAELERDTTLLSKDRRQAAPLIEGTAERRSIFRNAEADVEALISGFLEHAESKLREIRRKEIGDELAEQEQKRGSKTDEQYAQEAEDRRQARAQAREEELVKQREIERAEKRRQVEERRRRQEEDERRAKEKAEQEEKIRAERKAERERLEKRQREIEAELDEKVRRLERAREEKRERERERERREREQELEREREREREREQEREQKREKEREESKLGDVGRDGVSLKEPSLLPEQDQKLDDEALELLLKEGQELAEKSRQRPELERSESLEPPPRKSLPPRSIVPRDPYATKRTAISYSATNIVLDTLDKAKHPSTSNRVEPLERRDWDQRSSTPRDSTYHRAAYAGRLDYDKSSRPYGSERRHSSRYDDDRHKAEKEAWKDSVRSQREREAREYKRARMEGKDPPRSMSRSRGPSAAPEKDDRTYREREKAEYRKRYHSRSPTPTRRSRALRADAASAHGVRSKLTATYPRQVFARESMTEKRATIEIGRIGISTLILIAIFLGGEGARKGKWKEKGAGEGRGVGDVREVVVGVGNRGVLTNDPVYK